MSSLLRSNEAMRAATRRNDGGGSSSAAAAAAAAASPASSSSSSSSSFGATNRAASFPFIPRAGSSLARAMVIDEETAPASSSDQDAVDDRGRLVPIAGGVKVLKALKPGEPLVSRYDQDDQDDEDGEAGEHAEVVCQVVSLHRFVTDSNYLAITGTSNAATGSMVPVICPTYGYDVVLSDGVNKVKCLLAPQLNEAVERGFLVSGTIVHLLEAAVRFDETSIGARGFVLVRRVRWCGVRKSLVLHGSASHLRFVSPPTARERKHMPLTGHRHYYLHLFADDEPDFFRLKDSEYVSRRPEPAVDKDATEYLEAERLFSLMQGEHEDAGYMEDDGEEEVDGRRVRSLASVMRMHGLEELDGEPLLASSDDEDEDEENEDEEGSDGDEEVVNRRKRKKASRANEERRKRKKDTSPTNPRRQPPLSPAAAAARTGRALPPPVIVRVLSKSRMFHFGTPDKRHAFPFNFELIVSDGTARAKVVVWNRVSRALYQRIRPGDVIRVSRYRFRTWQHNQDVELSVNPRDPVGKVTIVDELAVPESRRLPQSGAGAHLRLLTVRDVLRVADNSVFDVAGVVSYVSPFVVERSGNPSSDRTTLLQEALSNAGALSGNVGGSTVFPAHELNRSFEFRWVTLFDASCQRRLAIKVYSNSARSKLAALRPGKVVVLTNVNIFTVGELESSRAPRSVCAVTTQFSTLWTTRDLKGKHAVVRHALVDALLAWAEDLPPAAPLASRRSLYTWQCGTFAEHVKTFGQQLTRISALRGICESLKLGEQRFVSVQCVLNGFAVTPTGVDSVHAGFARRSGRRRPRTRSKVPPVDDESTIYGRMSAADVNGDHVVTVDVIKNPVPHAHVGGPGSASLEFGIGQDPKCNKFLAALTQITSSRVLDADTWKKFLATRNDTDALDAMLLSHFEGVRLVLGLRLEHTGTGGAEVVLMSMLAAE